MIPVPPLIDVNALFFKRIYLENGCINLQVLYTVREGITRYKLRRIDYGRNKPRWARQTAIAVPLV